MVCAAGTDEKRLAKESTIVEILFENLSNGFVKTTGIGSTRNANYTHTLAALSLDLLTQRRD